MRYSLILVSTCLLLCEISAVGMAQESQTDQGITREQAVSEALKKAISDWAGAWQSQIPDLYIAHYTLDYVPPGFASREEWLASRRSKIREPDYIKIRLIDFELIDLTEDRATTRFTLVYERPGYSDQTYKELILSNQHGLWLIEQENNLEVKVL